MPLKSTNQLIYQFYSKFIEENALSTKIGKACLFSEQMYLAVRLGNLQSMKEHVKNILLDLTQTTFSTEFDAVDWLMFRKLLHFWKKLN